MRYTPTPFSRTMRSLRADSFRRSWWTLSLAGVLLSAWAGWFTLAEVSVYEVSQRARLEVDQAVHPLETRVEGRITENELALGRQVHAGDVLIKIDDRAIRLRLEEEQAREESLRPQIQALRAEIDTAEHGLEDSRALGRAAVEETAAEQRAAEASARFAEESLARLSKLRGPGLITEEEYQRARVDLERAKEVVQAAKHRQRRLELDRRARTTDQRGQKERLRRQVAELEGELVAVRRRIERLEFELSQCVLYAPIDGKIGQVESFPVGSIVGAGDRVGAIVPTGQLRIVSEFVPRSALGRIRKGQIARLRLEGFPWPEFGSIESVVTAVATEAKNGTVRVELSVASHPSSIPIEHGLEGQVEVLVDRISPAQLVVRAAGKAIAPEIESQTSALAERRD